MDREDKVRVLFHDALVELLEHYGGSEPLLLAPTCSKGKYDLCAVIGLAEQDFRATIKFTASKTCVKALMDENQQDYGDWLGELSNQLAGRFKNKIADYGLFPKLSTPAVIAGKELETLKTAASGGIEASECVIAEYSGGEILASMQMELDSGLELASGQAVEVATEGSLELF